MATWLGDDFVSIYFWNMSWCSLVDLSLKLIKCIIWAIFMLVHDSDWQTSTSRLAVVGEKNWYWLEDWMGYNYYKKMFSEVD